MKPGRRRDRAIPAAAGRCGSTRTPTRTPGARGSAWAKADATSAGSPGRWSTSRRRTTSPDIRFPTPEDVREPERYAARVAELKAENRFVCGEVDNPFKRLWHLRGYENALVDYLANPEVLEAVYDRLFAVVGELCVRMARAGVDMVKVVGDVSMQDRITMGPASWRKFDKPRWGRLIDACRAENPETVFFFHSDGKLDDLIDDLVEVGFTVINPIQPECMNPIEVKRRWGDRITMHGGISIQRTLPFGTVEEVRREVETLVRHCGYNGGLVVMPSNNIQPDTPIENILACYDAAREFTF